MVTQASKAKRVDAAKQPTIARAEVVDKTTRVRLEQELDAALKRKPTSEVKLAGALRAIASLSPALRGVMSDATSVMVRRGSFARDLYAASIRTLAECGDKQTTALLKKALTSDDAGGNATLSAACFSRDAELAAPLAKLAASSKAHLAFCSETARLCRRESNGGHLTAIAPMIKESHRIALCVDLFVPLARSAPIPVQIGPALGVLRGAERHLGRWLVLADVATKAGDTGPLEEATQKAQVGPSSSRAAWSLVQWALSETKASVLPGASVAPPSTRPTVELVARLSDRPSADRDTTFLFRMARARAASARPMLEGLAKSIPLGDEVAIRAASYLARDHGREDMKEALVECAQGKRDELRGVAVAALWDAGAREKARELSDELVTSRNVTNVAWGALVRAAHATQRDADFVVASETPFRWVQWGWLE